MKHLYLLLVVPAVLMGSACGPNAQAQVAQQETARQAMDAEATAIAAPTIAAAQTAEAYATQAAALATQVSALATAQAAQSAQIAQAASTATAVAQATQDAKDLDARVQAAVAATQQALPTATPVPPTPAPPAPAPPAVVVVPQQPAPPPVYVPVPVPAPTGNAPQYLIQAINEANNATVSAKWDMNPNELVGHMTGRELNRSDTNVRTLSRNRTRVSSRFVSGYITSWTYDSPTKATVTANEDWQFINYDADTAAVKSDLGVRLYRNIYTIENTPGLGWKVSYDDVLNPSGDPV
jgi:hypothetical protein